ncbi:transcription factor 25 isoform X3 [Myxocyprinus asiaticus]|uniref:transcription factor 25 isoform X3 n=1 Tax=Myxocyprinus asiaticus TaxID=70543 RepID=UPI0022225651|nr:transcription factor 25 isoform X3 [Myxocyprinus asiaticus]
MSSRALRRLKGEQRAQAALHHDDEDQWEEEEDDEEQKKNIYELIGGFDVAEGPSDEETTERPDEGAPLEKHNVKSEKSSKRKKKKKKKKKAPVENGKEAVAAADDIDALLETLDKTKGLSHASADGCAAEHRPVLYVEHRNLNPETELKRYFGARAVLGDQRPKQRQRQFHRCTWMTVPKDTWPRFSRPERALYCFECAFHPVFSLTSGTSRLDYRRPENRAFYLALFKHVMFLEKRGCPRTALEYCKLILSLDPDDDPLCMLLFFDFLCLRCREYNTLIRLYEEWEVHRNLSQLPNFAFSVALSYYQLSQQEDVPPEEQQQLKHKSDVLLQDALIMFPGALMPLLDLCTVQPDAAVSSHAFFGPKSQIGQPPALSQLLCLYVGRCHTLWKEPGLMLWLEENVRTVLTRVDTHDPYVEDCQNKRKQRYQSAPRNIHRHVLMAEIKEATATLPLEVTTQPGMAFDPLPPLDSIVSYSRPERQNAGAESESTLSLFFRSLLPNFNLQRPEDGQEVARAGRELNQEVNRLMVAMRDMLANIQFQEPQWEDNPDRDEEEWD